MLDTADRLLAREGAAALTTTRVAAEADILRRSDPPARRAHPLGGVVDLDVLERVHGRRRALGRARGGRGPRAMRRLLATTHGGSVERSGSAELPWE